MDVQVLIADWAQGQRLAELDAQLAHDPWDVLSEIGKQLRQDGPIDALERLETVLKRALRSVMAPPVSGAVARRLAGFSSELGFLLKYKSYAVKASSPLGYSVFLQEPGQGFSFQRHIEHKTEVFHVLDVLPGGFVFLCEFDEWQREYDQEAFGRWLAGQPDDRYEPHRIWPAPGDTFVIDRLGVVHTVVGCVIEEFATISTDMVVRLHDQNVGRTIPASFRRPLVEARLADLPSPEEDALVAYRTHDRQAIVPEHVPGARVTVLADRPVTARVYRMEVGQVTAPVCDLRAAASLFVRRGSGRLLLGDDHEIRRATPPSLGVVAGQLTLVPAGVHYALASGDRDGLVVSEHRLPLDVAFR